jgi:hypothetical protein
MAPLPSSPGPPYCCFCCSCSSSYSSIILPLLRFFFFVFAEAVGSATGAKEDRGKRERNPTLNLCEKARAQAGWMGGWMDELNLARKEGIFLSRLKQLHIIKDVVVVFREVFFISDPSMDGRLFIFARVFFSVRCHVSLSRKGMPDPRGSDINIRPKGPNTP